jgi:hypothetical protein
MADIRTLKLALLADTKQFIDGLDKADKETRTFSDKLGSALKTGALAFAALGAAAGAAAIKIGVDAVKGAIEDAKAQATLAQTLRNTTKATDNQIASVEEYITKTERASAVNADQLRPSLQRLLISTKDLTEAQKLQSLALDIAAGTNKDLLSVSDALAKASDGNFKALKNLGVELKTSNTTTKKVTVSQKDLTEAKLKTESASLRLQTAQERLAKAVSKSGADSLEAKKAQNALESAQLSADKSSSKLQSTIDKQGKTIKVTKEETISFDEAVRQLTANFAGQADAAANTFEGRMTKISLAIDEAKDALGFALLPFLERFAAFVEDPLLPALRGIVDGLTGKQKSVVPSFLKFGEVTSEAEDAGYGFGSALRELAGRLAGLNTGINEANSEKGLVGFINNLTKLLEIINAIITPFTKLVELSQRFAESESQRRIELPNLIPETTNPNSVFNKPAAAVVNVYNNIKTAVDPQATARAITKVTNTATKTTGIKPFVFGFR